MTPVDVVLDAVRSHGLKLTRCRDGWSAQCPAHDDRTPSLSVNEGEEQRAVIHCHAGCATERIVEALGLDMSDLFANNRSNDGGGQILNTYDYPDKEGRLLFQVVRFVPKDFRQRRPDGNGGWIWNLKGVQPVLYRLPDVRRAINAGQTIYLVEGEKDADRLAVEGVTATCNPMGAGKWRDSYTAQLTGAHDVVIIADLDLPGIAHTHDVASRLSDHVDSVAIMCTPYGKDAFDHIETGHGIDEFISLDDEHGTARSEPPTPSVPPLDEDALHGVFGDFVHTYAPHTEADPLALLVDALASFGNAVGLRPHFMIGTTRHAPRLFVVLAGDTAKSRKGTSHHDAMDVLKQADHEWWSECQVGGLSTGEGLINRIADVYAWNKDTHQMELVQEKDARAMIVETEFGRALTAAAREGNTLSMVLRQAWDGEDLKVTTRKDPLEAKGRHVSLISHITIGELALKLSDTDVTNGLANRLLFFAVHRPHLLPSGGALPSNERSRIGRAFGEALTFARNIDRMSWSPEAKAVYEECYRLIESRTTGDAIDSVTTRSSPYLIRLSMLYALGDRSEVIGIDHLRAAWAVLRCSDATAFRLFKGRHGNRTADRLLRLLREHPEGLSRTELDRAFSGHVDRLMLDEFREQGLVREQVVDGTGGRPRRMTFAVERPDSAQPFPAFTAFTSERKGSGPDEPSTKETNK